MNQILSVDMPRSNHGPYRNRNSNKADIKTIIIIFCVILILFAIIMIITFSKLGKDKEGSNQQNTVITGTQPTINVEVLSETTLNIIVSHDKQLSSISYNWNNGENIEEINIAESTKELQIEKPIGTNTLNIKATDINGVTQTYSQQYTGIQAPLIKMERQGAQVKIIVESDKTISYISYNWDGGEEKQVQINDVRTEQLLDVANGKHVLNVVAVDEEKESSESFEVIGDIKPTLNMTTDNVNLFIKASDDEGLTKMTIQVYDTGEIREFEINDKQYSKTIAIQGEEIPLQRGENKIIITVYNVNELSMTLYKKVYK